MAIKGLLCASTAPDHRPEPFLNRERLSSSMFATRCPPEGSHFFFCSMPLVSVTVPVQWGRSGYSASLRITSRHITDGRKSRLPRLTESDRPIFLPSCPSVFRAATSVC